MPYNKATFVNFCVDIGRGNLEEQSGIYRPFELYKSGLLDNINNQIPLIIYSSVKNINIPQHRTDNNFRYYNFNTDNIQQEFPNFNQYLEKYNDDNVIRDEICSSLIYYSPLVTLKFKKIMDNIKNNPFKTEYFYWIDCFFERGAGDNIFNNIEMTNQWIDKLNNKSENKFLVFVSETPYPDFKLKLDMEITQDRYPFGFFWGGHKDILEKVYKEYFNIYFKYLDKLILTEELIFFILMNQYPDLFKVVHLSNLNYKRDLMDYINS